MEEFVEALVCPVMGGPYTLKSVRLGEMREDELLVQMVATGICHTDLAVANGTIPVPFPMIGGHEGAGIALKIGSKVTEIEVGDHVLLSFSSCGTCPSCCRGEKAYCFDAVNQNFRCSRDDGSKSFHLGTEDVSSHFFGQSSFAQKSIVRASSAVKIDKSLPLDILCPLGCGVQTGAGTVMNVLRPLPGMSIVVFGAGAVGLCSIMAASISPATMIIAVDVVDSRLDLAHELGATHTINPTKTNAVDEIRRLTGGYGADRALDATGNVGVIRDMLACAAPNSIAATVGAPAKGVFVEIEPLMWLQRGVSYRGVHQGSSNPPKFLPILIEMWKSGRLPLEKLIRSYDYREFDKALADIASGACIKAVLNWPQYQGERSQIV